MSSTHHLSTAYEGLKAALNGIHGARRAVYEQAMELGTAFQAKRAEIAGGEFSNLNLQVRDRQDGRSIQIGWVKYHFRNGKRSGMSALPKPRSTNDFDLATIKRHSPEWLHALAVETELSCRPLRDALNRLTAAEREMRVCASRFGFDPASLIPSSNPSQVSVDDASSNDDSYVDPFSSESAQ